MENSALLEELTKKDDDARILAHSDTHLVIETSLDLENEIDEALSDPTLLHREAMQPKLDVVTRVIRTVFIANGALNCIIMMMGFFPYEFLSLDERPITSVILFAISVSAAASLYAIMLVYRRHKRALLAWLMWCMMHFMTVVTLSSLLGDMAPLQFSLIVCLQSWTVVVYTFTTPEQLEPWRSFYIQLIVGVVGWLVGIYAFIRQRDWIVATVLFLFTAAVSAYSAFEIKQARNFCLSEEDLIRAIIQYYGDPVLIVVRKLKEKLAHVHVDDL